MRVRIPGDERGTRRWRELKRELLILHPVCLGCLGRASELDHILPLADGGDMWDAANIQTICRPCHRRKTAMEARARAAVPRLPRRFADGPTCPHVLRRIAIWRRVLIAGLAAEIEMMHGPMRHSARTLILRGMLDRTPGPDQIAGRAVGARAMARMALEPAAAR